MKKIFLFTTIYSTLFAETQIYLAPRYGFPLGALAEHFEGGLGGEVWLRELEKKPYFSFLQPLGLIPSVGLSLSHNSMDRHPSSVLNLYQFFVSLGYDVFLPYEFVLHPRFGLGAFYGSYYMAQRNKRLSFVNPLLVTGISIRYPLYRELLLEMGIGHNGFFIGDPLLFEELTISLGITIRLGLPPLTKTARDPMGDLQSAIIVHYERGEYEESLRKIEELEQKSPDDVLIDKYRSLIFQQRKRQEAKAHLEAGRHFRAIVLLKQAPDIPEAVQELRSLRESLNSQVSSLLAQGIAAYERSDFEQCISFMEKVLLIDPENSEAQIYLPRAQNRKRALERLK
ncbi:MAG: hypothetical protein NZM25_01025 [Leptospiraceae bacterium]|nr:hypothetical protein [Leptospiraceae bacterium]MDW8306306.1 hypothetical protein [Leptospiraceae bacterium]